MPLLKYVTLTAVALLASQAAAGDPYAAGADVQAAYQKYVNGLASGDAEATTAAFAETVYLVAGPTCTPASPCVSPEAVKATVERWVGMGLKDKLLDEPQALGNMLVSRVEIVWDNISDMGIDRILGTNFIEAEDGLITRKIFIPDRNDEQTLKLVEAVAASE